MIESFLLEEMRKSTPVNLGKNAKSISLISKCGLMISYIDDSMMPVVRINFT